MTLVAELTAPALFVAGASTSLHCALMCGAINAALVTLGLAGLLLAALAPDGLAELLCAR